MIDIPSIQWFPGHMAKTRRLITSCLKQVDLVVELVDARAPQSSRNPELDHWIGSKPRLLLLNKADAADPVMTQRWVQYYQKKGIQVLPCDCKSGKGLKQFTPRVKEELKEQLAARARKGMLGKPIRLMIVGVPNVGKSSFINRMCGSKRAKVEDRPGVTRGTQWVHINNEMELLDMPGVLWPKFEDPKVGETLAFTGAVKDDVLDVELLALRLLSLLKQDYPDALLQRYKLENLEEIEDVDLLEAVAKKRGMLMSGGAANTERAAITVLDEFRAGKLGRITLDRPQD